MRRAGIPKVLPIRLCESLTLATVNEFPLVRIESLLTSRDGGNDYAVSSFRHVVQQVMVPLGRGQCVNLALVLNRWT